MKSKLESNLLKLSNETGRYLPKEYRVSELVYCPAKAYFFRKLKMKPKLNGAMLSGTMLHEKLAQITKGIKEFKDAKFEVECNYTSPGKLFTIKGHADVVTSDTVYEFKFSGSNIPKYGPPIQWLFQANAYAYLLGKPKWKIIAIHNSTLEVNVMDGITTDIMFNVITDRAGEIYTCLQEDRVPSGPAQSWECERCEVKTVCTHYITKEGGLNAK